MAGRLHTKVGFVPDEERLGGSSDAVLVDEPSIGAIARSKGSLFLVVTAPPGAPRASEAAAFLAQAVDHEYFYDESAGIAVVLEKAVRTAHRRLLQRREAHEVAPESLGLVAAVVREHELYVVATGDVDAFLARQGALLVLPDEGRGSGFPAREEPRLGVWRGEVMAGDTILLAAGDVARRIDAEEIRRTITTLHPETASLHLHHQYVAADAAGAETPGSDAVVIIEVSEIPFARPERALGAVRPADTHAAASRRDAGQVVQPSARPPVRPGVPAQRAAPSPAPRLVAGPGASPPAAERSSAASTRPAGAVAPVADPVPGRDRAAAATPGESRGVREPEDRVLGPGGARLLTARTTGGESLLARARARVAAMLPRRRLEYRRVTPLADRREDQRRIALVALGALALILVVGLTTWVASGGLGGNRSIGNAKAGEAALAAAMIEIEKVYGEGDLVAGDPQKALTFLREAWRQLNLAEEAGVTTGKLRPLRDQVSEGLDRLYGVVHVSTATVIAPRKISTEPDLSGLIRGPDGAAYTIDRSTSSVVRLDLSKKTALAVVTKGDGGGNGIGDPWILTVGGPDVVILDRNGALWRWRPSDKTGRGTLATLRIGGDLTWGSDIRDLGTYVTNPDLGIYNLYVIDPSSEQILRYSPAADGSGYPQDPTGYLATASDVSGYSQMLIDGDIYVLTSKAIVRLSGGRADEDFEAAVLPDEPDLRPGHDYERMTGSASRREGRMYAYDAEYGRIIAFEKDTGEYVEQYLPAASTPIFGDVRGMFLVARGEGEAPWLYWVSADRLYRTALQEAPAVSASPSPATSASPEPSTTKTKAPAKTKAPTGTATPS